MRARNKFALVCCVILVTLAASVARADPILAGGPIPALLSMESVATQTVANTPHLGLYV
jgi:hypothetical protein